jgi:hypothetical protein
MGNQICWFAAHAGRPLNLPLVEYSLNSEICASITAAAAEGA